MIVREIIIHHTVSSRDRTTLKDVDSWHRARDFTFSSLGFYVGYHFVILGNGHVRQTREENELGAHAIPNDGRIGIALIGDFMGERPSDKQLNSLTILLDDLKKRYNLQDKDIFGHREKNPTLCPGKNLFEWLILYRKVSFLKQLIIKLKKLLGRY